MVVLEFLFLSMFVLVLSSDFDDKIPIYESEDTFALTTCFSKIDAVLRNTFVIERPFKEDEGPYDVLNEVVHYGQNFTLRLNPSYVSIPFYVSSITPTVTLVSRFTRNQLIFVTSEKSYKCGITYYCIYFFFYLTDVASRLFQKTLTFVLS
jgi:hypothetical protein